MRLVHWLLAGSVVAASACADPALEQRLADLEKKVETIEKSGGAKGQAPGFYLVLRPTYYRKHQDNW